MEGINGTIHPLQTHIILENIFGNLKFQDLKACRCVCKEWLSSSTKSFYPLAKVTIDDEERRHDASNRKSLSEFLDFMLDESSTLFNLPFPNSFRLVGVKTIDPLFWSNFGQQLHNLELCNVNFCCSDSFRSAVFRNCPNLRKLSIKRIRVDGKRPRKPSEMVPTQYPPNLNLRSLRLELLHSSFGIGAMELIGHFPCLENLDMINIFNIDYAHELLSSLSIARMHDCSRWKLNGISLDLTCLKGRPDLISLLTDGIPPLNTLGLRFWLGRDGATEIGKRIMNAHAGTIRKFGIRSFYPFDMGTNIFSLPNNGTFKNLQELKINARTFNSTNFPFNAPNLKVVALYVCRFHVNDIDANLVFSRCVQLRIYNKASISTEDLHKLGRWFPNLNKLRIERLNNEKLAMVCQLWPNLTHLEILGAFVDESGISGLVLEDATRMNQKQEAIPITIPQANLSSLKYLETLRLKLESESVPGYCSVAYGVLPLALLRHLDVSNIKTDRSKWSIGNSDLKMRIQP